MIKGKYNDQPYNFDINHDCKLQRTKDRQYYLIVPESIQTKILPNTNNIIVSDIGIRTFQTCLTKNNVVEIGDNISEKIKGLLYRKDKIVNDNNIKKKIKAKNRDRLNRKLKNLVDELHWKTINYMTKNYDTIIIGDINSSGIVRKSNGLPKIVRRVALELRLYQFKQKLKYKCFTKNRKLIYVDERYTSKMCSKCGWIHEKLGGSKRYECEECKTVMGRDINGARNIYIKSVI